jgi:hypothetical protein
VEVIEMIEELFVIECARREAEREAPGEPVASGRAVTHAVWAYESGASVPEAISEARRFARAWARHGARDHTDHHSPAAA